MALLRQWVARTANASLALPIRQTIIVRRRQLYLSRNQRQANFTPAPGNIFARSAVRSSQTARSFSNEFTISDNPVAAASRVPRSPVYRDTRAGKRSPSAAENLPNRLHTKSAADRDAHQIRSRTCRTPRVRASPPRAIDPRRWARADRSAGNTPSPQTCAPGQSSTGHTRRTSCRRRHNPRQKDSVASRVSAVDREQKLRDGSKVRRIDMHARMLVLRKRGENFVSRTSAEAVMRSARTSWQGISAVRSNTNYGRLTAVSRPGQVPRSVHHANDLNAVCLLRVEHQIVPIRCDWPKAQIREFWNGWFHFGPAPGFSARNLKACSQQLIYP